MLFIVNLFSFLWLVRTVKFVLFWIFLWQLKNYHVGRFADHFRTHQGKKIFLNAFQAIKIILLAGLLVNYHFFNIIFWLLTAIYFAESGIFALSIIRRNVRKPDFTFKAVFLTAVAMLAVMVYMAGLAYFSAANFWFVFALLAFDIALPLVVSVIVLLAQPFFVMARNRILEKARQKMGKHENLTVIAITGSYGKTSTKEILSTILSEKFKVLATPEHKNSEIGIAQTILQDLKPEHKIFIVEMGAYNKGGIDLLCQMVKPDMGVVTGVNEQHLATFGSLENLLSAEGGQELAAQLPKHGILVVNGENKHCRDLYNDFKGHKRIYASKPGTVDADLLAEQIAVKERGLDFVAISRQKQTAHFAVPVLGAHNIQNVLGAAVVAKELGMSLEEISAACKKIRPEQAGIILSVGAHGITVIDSSYSANPDGVVADLDYLKIFNGKKIVVMPCLIELGGESARIHEELGKKMAQVCDVAIITTKDKFSEISTGFISQGIPEHKVVFCENQKDIFTMITTMCKAGDAVLLEGGRPKELIRLLNEK